MIKKIAVDSGPLNLVHKVRGIGVNTRELILAFGRLSSSDFVFGESKLEVQAVDFSKADLSAYDLVHYQYFNPFFRTLPKIKPAKKVILTIHDLIPLVYPKRYRSGIRGKINFWLQKKNLKNVDRIITISQISKKDIVNFLSYPRDKVDVVYLASRDIFRKIDNQNFKDEIAKKYNLPDTFVLYVGDINYNKNIYTLAKACIDLDLNLVIVGKQAFELSENSLKRNHFLGPRDWVRFLFGRSHPEIAHLKELHNLLSKSNKIVRLGFLSDEDLVSVYNLASVYVQPSFYEGFGLPLLEAMSCGTPVLASKISAHQEIASDAVLFFDPFSVSDLKLKLKKILSDKALRNNLITKGFERSSDFSWPKTAKEVLKVYEKTLSEK